MRIVGVGRRVRIAGTRDERVAAIARLQRGRVARWQLLAVGLTSREIDRMLAVGQLYRLHRGVYAVGHLAPVELGRETAALLACPESAVVSHHTAAALWGFRGSVDERDPIDVTIAQTGTINRPGIRAHRTTTLLRKDVRIHRGLPVTSPARTVLDMAETQTARQVERAIEEGIAKKILQIEQLEDVIRRAGGRRGAAILTAVLRGRTTSSHSRSETEERALQLLREAAVPRPEMNAALHGYTADFVWRRHRVVLEVDGHPFHSSRTAFERDRHKDAALRAAGYDVIRVSMTQVWEEPYVVIALVVRALTQAEDRRPAILEAATAG